MLEFLTRTTDIQDDAIQLDNRTALHLAAAHGDVESIASLLNAGASISVKDVTGQTSCDLALNAGYFTAAAMLSGLTEDVFGENVIVSIKLR